MKNLALILIALFSLSKISFSQSGLEKDSDFFYAQLKEYNEWLSSKGLDKYFKVKDLSISPELMTLYLQTNEDCESTIGIWEGLKKMYFEEYNIRFEAKLFDALSFQMDVPKDSIQIKIECATPKIFSVDIYFKRNRLRVDEKIEGSMGTGTIEIPIDEVKNTFLSSKGLVSNVSIRKVREGVSQFLISYYKEKGTPILYKAKIDTTKTFFNELTYEISHLSHEVLDEGFYEFLKINVRISKSGENIEIDYNFQGKYGTGVFFVPRRNDYKDMEIKYSKDLMEYETNLIKKIEEHVRNYKE